MIVKDITSTNFDDIIANAGKPVLVDFFAPWCGPCRALAPIVEEVADEMENKMDFYKCNVDNEGILAARFNVFSIPTLIIFKDGKAFHTMTGSMPKVALLKEIVSKL